MSSPPKRADSVSSSSGRPASPSPARSFRTRMSTAVRRASTGLSFSQVGGKLSRSSSKASLKVDPSHTPAASEDAHMAPSPVAESPMREAAANAETTPALGLGHSPLINVTTASEPETPAAGLPAEHDPVQVTASPEQVPAGLPTHASEPVGAPAPAPAPAESSLGFSDAFLPVTPETAKATSSEEPPAPAEPEPEVASAPEPAAEPAPASTLPPPSAEPPVPDAIEDRRPDYFSYSDPVVPTVSSAPVPEPAPVAAEPEPVAPAPVPAASDETLHPQEVSHVHIPTDASTFAWSDEPALGHTASGSDYSEPTHSVEPSGAQIGKLSNKDSNTSMASSYGNLLPSQTRGRSGSVRYTMSMDDPFADHFAVPPVSNPMEVPRAALSPIQSVSMPEAVVVPHPAVSEEGEYRIQPIQDSPTPMRFPLPPMQDVISSAASRQKAASAYSLGERDGASLAEAHHDTDERIPLLQASQRSAPSRGKTTHVVATFATGPITTEVAAARTLQALGWVEYVLPDSSQYYHHAGMRVTTDVVLRDPRHLQRVTEYLEKTVVRETPLPPTPGWELWLKNAAQMKPDFKMEQCWVNHHMRVITGVPPPSISGDGLVIERFTDDDKLDMEYRYWCFIESHPAHVPLAKDTHVEAMDALKWSYTDCLLPTPRPAPPPFAPQECQELMNLLRSFEETPTDNALVVHSRVVSRVLLRVAQWRQVYFRPNKPLPNDALKGVRETRIPFRRAFMDFIIGCLCLGIPYIFLNRTLHQSFDEESGMYSAGPMLMVSACACLVAAVILSASVTFLSLPQLDDVPRLAGFLAIAFSAASMISAVIALFRYKTEIDRTIVYLGGEGLMVLSRRSIIFSLPLVFLAWAIAAFMTGITLYSFRGASVSSPVMVRRPFEPYTHWAVVGTLGALGGMLTIATIFARR